MSSDLIDWTEFNQAKRELGEAFVRILGYYREDGFKSVDAIEQAMKANDAAALVIPAHTLKGESRQFGARTIGDISERIEMTARNCVESRTAPDELASVVETLRVKFAQTLTALMQGVEPPPGVASFGRKPVFGRKTTDPVARLSRG